MGMEQEPSLEIELEDLVAKLEDVEYQLAEWHSLEGEVRSSPPSAKLRYPDQDKVNLNALRIGPAPAGLHETVLQVWPSFEMRWASRSEMVELRQSLDALSVSHGRDLQDLKAQEEKLAVRRERLKTLRLLAEVLDEFLLSERDTNPMGTA